MKRRDFLMHTVAAATGFSAFPLLTPGFSQPDLRGGGARKMVIIVGAGLAGLSAAYELTQAAHRVTALQARTRSGGRVHTLRDGRGWGAGRHLVLQAWADGFFAPTRRAARGKNPFRG